jgi:hypothetical protein
MMLALRSSETSVLTRATWRKIAGDGILHSQRRENLKSYIALLLYMQMIFVPIWKYTYESPQPITEVALLTFIV